MKICCDMDNVLNDLTPKTIALYNKRYGRNMTIESMTTYDFSRCFDTKTANELLALFEDQELWNSLQPLSGAQKGLKTLLDANHDVYIATATMPINFPWKCIWMQQYFPFVPLDHIMRINHKELLSVDVIIDDCLEHLIKNPAERICLTYPWNIDPKKDFVYDIIRCKNWNGIINAIKNIERKNKEFYE